MSLEGELETSRAREGPAVEQLLSSGTGCRAGQPEHNLWGTDCASAYPEHGDRSTADVRPCCQGKFFKCL